MLDCHLSYRPAHIICLVSCIVFTANVETKIASDDSSGGKSLQMDRINSSSQSMTVAQMQSLVDLTFSPPSENFEACAISGTIGPENLQQLDSLENNAVPMLPKDAAVGTTLSVNICRIAGYAHMSQKSPDSMSFCNARTKGVTRAQRHRDRMYSEAP